MGKHSVKRSGPVSGIVAGLLAVGALSSAPSAAADEGAPAVASAPTPPSAAQVGNAVRTVLEFNRERPWQPNPNPGVRLVQVVGDPLFNRRVIDGKENQFAVALYDSQAGQEYRKAFGAGASDDGVEEVCGTSAGCDGYVKGILNTSLPAVSQADRINVVSYSQRTGGCKGLPTGALQRCQSAKG
ncbi:hypothetical protein PBI_MALAGASYROSE_80 [Mycobacterium phage MalagasyRose]|uniref:Uncharacterized protein n=1 Tax=Mycobacterium phage MalagasyRose TaxID=2599870 RepID=A0A5J6TES6_9CAUD|nr:hypothetical protein QEH39_gp08 [Mycobacterium phage MalagasyRose]QFG08928.1 hypothetical protein PBI_MALAGASYROSE_80 [Mycobacterium phage MalagasyRose]